ncbi:hypothetical protein Tco_0554320 [Tanacetum coccineum]
MALESGKLNYRRKSKRRSASAGKGNQYDKDSFNKRKEEKSSRSNRARLKETQTDLVGFAGEVTKPLGKMELEVYFGNEGLFRRTTMKFTIIRAPSPYNVILGRTTENFKGNTFLNPLNDEIRNTKRYRHFGYLDDHHLGMSNAGKEAGNRRRASGLRMRKDKGNKGRQCNRGNLGESNLVVIGGGLSENWKSQ